MRYTRYLIHIWYNRCDIDRLCLFYNPVLITRLLVMVAIQTDNLDSIHYASNLCIRYNNIDNVFFVNPGYYHVDSDI